MWKAEAKVLFVISAYTLVSILLLVTATQAVITKEKDIQVISDYFTCQSTGLQTDKLCNKNNSESLQSTPMHTLLNVAIILQGLIPIFALVYVAKCTCECKLKRLSYIYS